jgi:hypothetical protein
MNLLRFLHSTSYISKRASSKRSNCSTSTSQVPLVYHLLAFCCLLVVLPSHGVLATSNLNTSELSTSTQRVSTAKVVMVQKKQVQNLAAFRAGGGKQVVGSKNISWGTRIRNVLFPIHGNEVKKFLLVGSIKFFVILALTLTRDNKDTMVVTECGAESIAFLKVRTCLHALIESPAIVSHTFGACCLDLWSAPSSHFIYWGLLENGLCTRQKDALLCHMHTVLCILLSL